MRSGDFHNKAKSAAKAAHKDSDQKQKNLWEEKKKRSAILKMKSQKKPLIPPEIFRENGFSRTCSPV